LERSIEERVHEDRTQADARSVAPTVRQLSPAAAAVGNRLLGSFIEAPSHQADSAALLQREETGGQGGGGGQQGGEAEGQGGSQQRDWNADRAAMETARVDLQMRSWKLDAFVGKALGDVQSIAENLGRVSQEYSKCYAKYSQEVAKAVAAVKSNQESLNVVMGLALGIGLAVALPEIAGFAALEESAPALAKGVEVVAHAGGDAVLHKTPAAGLTELAGAELKAGGLTPEGQQLGTWKGLCALYKQIIGISAEKSNLDVTASSAEYAIGEIKAQIGGGAGADMKVPELVEMMEAIKKADSDTASMEQGIQEATTFFTNLQQKALMSDPDPQKMEQDINIMAMAEMSDDEAPQLKGIKEYLNNIGVISAGSVGGSGGRLKVNFGAFYATPGDTRKAVAAAKAETVTMKAKYEELLAGGGGGGGE
jgi:hypothetical protein